MAACVLFPDLSRPSMTMNAPRVGEVMERDQYLMPVYGDKRALRVSH